MLAIEWIVNATGGRVYQKDPLARVTGFSIDSRTIRAGELFIALKGERTDGHHFLGDAFRKGASGALICSADEAKIGATYKDSFHNVIEVEDTKEALHRLAIAYRQQFTIPTVGITGSSGKTTTKELLSSIASAEHRAYRSPRNYNTEYGLPLALLHMPSATEVGVFELAMQRKGEIRCLAQILRPTIGVITNIGDAHLGFFSAEEGIAQAKWELIEGLTPDSLAVLNFDSAYLRERAAEFKRVASFGIESLDATYSAHSIDDTSLDGISFEVDTPKVGFRLHSKLPGAYNVSNILGAVAVAMELGIKVESIRKAVQEFKSLPHRMEVKQSELGIILDDSCNANPASTKEALKTLARLKSSRKKVFVFGDMLELGNRAVKAHREIANSISRLEIASIFTLGGLAKETGLALIEEEGWGKDRVKMAESIDELKDKILASVVDDRNLILVKGSRAMELDKLVDLL